MECYFNFLRFPMKKDVWHAQGQWKLQSWLSKVRKVSETNIFYFLEVWKMAKVTGPKLGKINSDLLDFYAYADFNSWQTKPS